LTINLTNYGLTETFQQLAAAYPDLVPGRITTQHRDLYQVVTTKGNFKAQVAGKMVHQASDPTSFPAVGDWVLLNAPKQATDIAIIQHILPRQSVLARQAAGSENTGQLIAANIDTIFICMSLNADFNLRRLERYLTIAWNSQATPVIVLTKADLCTDLPNKLLALADVSMGVDIIPCSAKTGLGFPEIQDQVKPSQTIVLVGSSGVGKSTLINHLLGQNQQTTKTIRRDDDKGRHATTHRQLLLLPNGGILIDTPGMRELQIFTGDLAKTFGDIETIATHCKFRDCTHQTEPGCAVQAAITAGTLTAARLASYQKLQRERSYAGLNARQLENEKINRLFGGKNEMKQTLNYVKNKRRH
jgi:ribosome biogenesis GTPase